MSSRWALRCSQPHLRSVIGGGKRTPSPPNLVPSQQKHQNTGRRRCVSIHSHHHTLVAFCDSWGYWSLSVVLKNVLNCKFCLVGWQAVSAVSRRIHHFLVSLGNRFHCCLCYLQCVCIGLRFVYLHVFSTAAVHWALRVQQLFVRVLKNIDIQSCPADGVRQSEKASMSF